MNGTNLCKVLWLFCGTTLKETVYIKADRNPADAYNVARLVNENITSYKFAWLRSFLIYNRTDAKLSQGDFAYINELGNIIANGNVVGIVHDDAKNVAKTFVGHKGRIRFNKNNIAYALFKTDSADEYSCSVAGVTFENRQSVIKDIVQKYDYRGIEGFEAKIVPEPENQYDKNALKVVLCGKHIGYVPRAISEKCAGKHMAAKVTAVKGGYDGLNYGIDINIFER